MMWMPLLAACSAADEGVDILPGHSRPVLQHDWPHPGELEFGDSGFAPADPDSALLTLPSGVRAFVIPDPGDPLVEVTAALPLGRHFEGTDEMGAADIAVGLLRRALSDRLGPDLVADVRVEEEPGMTLLGVEVMAEDWRPALGALIGVLRQPRFPEAGVSVPAGGPPPPSGRARALAELTGLVARYPLAPPEPGTLVRSASVRELALSALRPELVVLGVAGGMSRTAAVAALVELTGGWDPGTGAPREGVRPTMDVARSPTDPLHTVDVPGFMSWIALGHAMEAVAPADEAAMAVLEEVVNIRLNIATREIRGLTNRAMLLLPEAADGAGVLYLRTSGRSESVGPLIRYSMEELTRIRRADGEPTAEELEQAKGGLALGWWQDSLDGARRTAVTYAVETVRRGSPDNLLAWPSTVMAVTPEEVTAAARKYIDPSAMTAVVVGQIDEVRQARHPRWPEALDDVTGLLRPPGEEP
jgi:predicted Zn-dependent peptidase